MKMAVVGCEASGKTVFLCALADYYGRAAANNPTRLKLTPENLAANNFERFQYRQMRCLRQWPPATSPERTIEIKWSLRHGGKNLADIDMLEFGGETFRAAFRHHDGKDIGKQEGSAAELLKYLNDANFFVVLVSIKALLEEGFYTGDEDFDRETEAIWVTRGIIEFIHKHCPKSGLVIGLTQADKYQKELQEAGGARQLLAAHWPTVASATEHIPVVEVASVSNIDENGNPAEGYNTTGIQPVMRTFAKHCFNDENALENGSLAQSSVLRKASKRLLTRIISWVTIGAILTAAAFGTYRAITTEAKSEPSPVRSAAVAEEFFGEPMVIEKVVTNTVTSIVETEVTNTIEKIVEVPVTNLIETVVEKFVETEVTNMVETIIEVPVTNTVEKIVEVEVEIPVTNTVEKLVEVEVEKLVEVQVTNTVEKIVEVEVPVTNTVEKLVEVEVEKLVEVQVTNTVEKIVEVEVEVPVTNTVEKVVEVEVEKIVEVQVTNTVEKVVEVEVEKIVEVPVTNTVEKVVEVEKLVEIPVTNTIETVVEVEVPVTNNVETVVEKVVVVTNVVERPVEVVRAPTPAPAAATAPQANAATPKATAKTTAANAETQVQVPPGYRIWTDYNGRKIIAKWTGVAVDKSGITIVTRYDRRIDAVLWKFSAEDQEFIKSEIKRHEDKGEMMSDGIWVKNPLLKPKK